MNLLYAVTGTVTLRHADGSTVTRQVPTFYLHPTPQGILSAREAEGVAARIVMAGATQDCVSCDMHAEVV